MAKTLWQRVTWWLVFIQGQGMVDHVVTRKGDQHEVDIDFEQATGVSLFELLDDGSLTSRSGQQADVFNLAVQGTIGGMATASRERAQAAP